jgi:hypothetical protein
MHGPAHLAVHSSAALAIASLDRITSSHYALLFRDIHVLQRIMEL